MQPCKDFYSESPFFPLRYMTINVQVTNMPGLIILNVCAFCFFSRLTPGIACEGMLHKCCLHLEDKCIKRFN